MSKKLTLPILFVSLIANIIFLMMLVPIDSVTVGCSSGEKRLSVLAGDSKRMPGLRVRAEEVKNKTPPVSEQSFGIAEGAPACDGRTYKLYVL